MADATAEHASAGRLRQALDQAFDTYERAAHATGEASFDADLAEARVRFRLTGPQIADPVLLPVSHRRIAPSGQPDLMVCIFDKASTGFAPEIADTIDRRMTSSAETTTWTLGDLNLSYRREPMPSLIGFDRARSRAVLWLHDATQIEQWDRCRALLHILHWWLANSGWQAFHAAAVSCSKGGVLIGGKGGAGKSTTALACVRAGWRFAGDDLVIVQSTPQPRVENLFSTARLRMDMVPLLPEMQPAIAEVYVIDEFEKARLALERQYPASTFAGFPIHAIVLPRHSRKADFSVTPATRAEAMLSLAPSTMFVLQTDLATTFHRIAALVDKIPAYWCDVGPDLARIPPAIEVMLDRRASSR